MKLRLLLWKDCNRCCSGCCNKDWDLDNLPRLDMKELGKYKEVLLTGGEPMLRPEVVKLMVKTLRNFPGKNKRIYVYTAKTDDREALLSVLKVCDGVTITLHDQSDVENLKNFLEILPQNLRISKSVRLNVFENIDISSLDLNNLKVKENVVWIKNCPLPKDEVFKRA